MNWSMYAIDRSTHLKIVLVGLTAALLITAIGIALQQLNRGVDITTAQGPTIINAGAPIAFADRGASVIR